MANLEIRTVGQLQQFLGCDNAHWKVRKQESLEWAGTTTIRDDANRELWKGNVAITMDGENYRLRIQGGQPLPGFVEKARPVPGSASAIVQANGDVWWSSNMMAYWGKTWNEDYVKALRKIGWTGAKVIRQHELATMTPNTNGNALPPMGNVVGPMSSRVAQAETKSAPAPVLVKQGAYTTKMQVQPDGGVTISLPPLPPGFKYNEGGKPMNEATGKFASEATIQAAWDSLKTPQKASVPVSSTGLTGGGSSNNKSLREDDEKVWTNFEVARLLGEWDRERGYDLDIPESFDEEQAEAYEEGFYPPTEPEPEDVDVEEVEEAPMSAEGKLDAILGMLQDQARRINQLEGKK